MIRCPKCSSTLPLEADTCQFCGRDVSKVYRRADVSVHEAYASKCAPKSAWAAFAAISLFWIAEGLFHLAGGTGVIPIPLSPIMMVVGAVLLVIGAGFLYRPHAFRTSYHLLSGLVLVAGTAAAVEGMRISASHGWLGAVVAGLGGVTALTAGLMTYVAGRTITTFARR